MTDTCDNYISNKEHFFGSVSKVISSHKKWRELLGVVLNLGSESGTNLPCGLKVDLNEPTAPPSPPPSPLTPRPSTPAEEPAHVTDTLGPPCSPKGSAYAGKFPPQGASKSTTLNKKNIPEDDEETEEEDDEDQLNKSRCLPLSWHWYAQL